MKTKVVFVEYSSADKGQHFMTVLFIEDGKRRIIGRIYKEYDPEIKKYTYHAMDWSGHPIFPDVKNIADLKKKFIENGKSLSQQVPNFRTKSEPSRKRKFVDRNVREEMLRNIRNKPEIKRGVPDEREEELKNTYKEWDDLLTDETGDGRPFPEQTDEIESPFTEEMDRESELDQIREDDNEHERSDDYDLDR